MNKWMDEWYFLGIFTDDLFWFFPSFFFFSLFLFLNVKFREDLGLDLNFWVVDPFKNLVIQTLSLKMDLHIYQKACTQFSKVHRTLPHWNYITHVVTLLILYVLWSGVEIVIKDWLLSRRAPEPTDTPLRGALRGIWSFTAHSGATHDLWID